jgi:hypothetical protein
MIACAYLAAGGTFPPAMPNFPHPFPVILSYVLPCQRRVMGFGSAYRVDMYPHPYDQIQYSYLPVERVSNIERLNVKPEPGAVLQGRTSTLSYLVQYSAHMEVEFSSSR